ncbi:hypothetical protein ACFX2J_042477 [Malus domestica]
MDKKLHDQKNGGDESPCDVDDSGFLEEQEEDGDDDNIDTEDRYELEDDINKLSDVISLPKYAACFLLPRFNWKVRRANEEWFLDEDEVSEKVWLMKKTVVQFNARVIITCGICFDEYAYECESYIRTSINDGPASLMLKCPEPPCGAAVGPDLIGVSYVEGHRKIKWCPAPDCCYAVKYNGNADDDDTGMNDSSSVDCRTVGKWILKNKDDSHNVQWILVNTKPCPKCKRPIEKNQGCNTMTCRPPCNFRFCWYCLEPNVMYGCCNRYVYHPVADSEAESDKK